MKTDCNMKKIPEIPLPSYVRNVMSRFKERGFAVYIVGGTVRDALMGRSTQDYDLATDATPDEIIAIFPDYKTLLVGKQFGTIVLIAEANQLEITTYREDGTYEDGRHPNEVRYAATIYEDLQRRDFTMNALAYSPEEGLIDSFGGWEDIQSGIIRCVGSAERRFSEDRLRMLRALRFAAQLNFNLDESVIAGIRGQADQIHAVSQERIGQELSKLLLSEYPAKGLRLMQQTGLLDEILPELTPTVGYDQRCSHHDLELFEHILQVVQYTPRDLTTRLAALFHDIGKPDTFSLREDGEGHYYGHPKVSSQLARQIMTRLRYSNGMIDEVTRLIERHMDSVNIYTDKSIKKLLARMDQLVFKLFDLQSADILATNHMEFRTNVEWGRQKAQDFLRDNVPVNQGALAIDGHDLLDIGIPQGILLGAILRDLTDYVLEDAKRNERQILIQQARRLYQNRQLQGNIDDHNRGEDE